MDDPDFTADHLEELRAVDRGERVGFGRGHTPAVLLDLSEWRLVHWDAGARNDDGDLVPMEQVQHRVTRAGRIVLALAKSLDGTAPPSELLSQGVEKEEGET